MKNPDASQIESVEKEIEKIKEEIERLEEELRALYDRVSNPLLQFIEEFCVRDNSEEGYVFRKEFNAKFREWLQQKGLPFWKDKKIGSVMKNVLGIHPDKRPSPATGKWDWAWIGIRWKRGDLFSKPRPSTSEDTFQHFQDFQDNSESFSKTGLEKTSGKKLEILEISENAEESHNQDPLIETNCDLIGQEKTIVILILTLYLILLCLNCRK